MKLYAVIAGSESEYRAHLPEIFERLGVPDMSFPERGEYRGPGFRLIYADTHFAVRGHQDFELLRVGHWFDNPHVDAILAEYRRAIYPIQASPLPELY